MKNQTGMKRVLQRGAEACAVLLSCISLSACGAVDDGVEDESVGEVQQALVTDGYWRVAGGPAVYWLHGSRVCWVRDEGMLMAMRWTTTPQATNSNFTASQLKADRIDDGACHYPERKLLKTYDSDWVYRTGYPAFDEFCHVKSQTQLGKFGGWSQVLTMQRARQKADYSEGGGVGAEGVWTNNGARFYAGDCPDPTPQNP